MLNISPNSVSVNVKERSYPTLTKVESKRTRKVLLKLITITLILGIIMMFLPWTQNIRSNGSVTALRPDQKPQTVHSLIGGRVENWYVQEGDFVSKGDTIVQISEIKDAYFDDQLLPRTQNQLDLKQMTVESYQSKMDALNNQLIALKTQKNLKLNQARIKLQQARLKVQNDSISFRAAQLNFTTADRQFNRMDSLYDQGLKSLTDLETRTLKRQQAKAYEIEAQNKWLNSQNELITLQIELSTIQTKFETDYAKTQSDLYSASSIKFDSEGQVTKLRNQLSNYTFRNGLYFILAPQDGYISKTHVNGIGETLKEGSPVVTIVPDKYELAVELFIEPLDLPLLEIGQKVRIQFDGWPAIVFSGWPNASHGTYGGKIYGIDQHLGENGKYRILVQQDPDEVKWPDALRYGGGASTMILLDEVPVYYELWRKINGFPPNFYKKGEDPKDANKSTKKH